MKEIKGRDSMSRHMRTVHKEIEVKEEKQVGKFTEKKKMAKLETASIALPHPFHQ